MQTEFQTIRQDDGWELAANVEPAVDDRVRVLVTATSPEGNDYGFSVVATNLTVSDTPMGEMAVHAIPSECNVTVLHYVYDLIPRSRATGEDWAVALLEQFAFRWNQHARKVNGES